MKQLCLFLICCLSTTCSIPRDSQASSSYLMKDVGGAAPTFLLWDYTQDSLRFKLDMGPLVSFTNANYRFPYSKEEMIEFDYQCFKDRYSRSKLRKLYKGVVYERFGADSCTIRGGFYGDRYTTVLYDTPVTRLDKFYMEASHNGKWDNRAAFLLLNTKTQTPISFFDENDHRVIIPNEQLDFFSDSLKSFYRIDSGQSLFSVFPNDTIPAYFILQYEKGVGVSALGMYPNTENKYLVYTGQDDCPYNECSGTVPALSSAYLNRLSFFCDYFCKQPVTRIIFFAPLKI